jgi:hypothetical protein
VVSGFQVAGKQGDQIGRKFAQFVTVYFGQLIENYRGTYPTFVATLVNVQAYELIYSKKGLVHFGRFFHNVIWSPCWETSTTSVNSMLCSIVLVQRKFFSYIRTINEKLGI